MEGNYPYPGYYQPWPYYYPPYYYSGSSQAQASQRKPPKQKETLSPSKALNKMKKKLVTTHEEPAPEGAAPATGPQPATDTSMNFNKLVKKKYKV